MNVKHYLIGSALMLFASLGFAQSEMEREQLKLLLEQLANIERISQQAKNSASVAESERYRFDYQQLDKDIAAIRAGVSAYLTPIRAQPREIVDFEANYRKEGVKQ